MTRDAYTQLRHRIYVRFFNILKQEEIPSTGKLKIKFLTSPLGLPSKPFLHNVLKENMDTIDSFVVGQHEHQHQVISTCTGEEEGSTSAAAAAAAAAAATADVPPQWHPHETQGWDFLRREFVRVNISDDEETPICTLSGKCNRDDAAESANAEDPAIGFADSFFHCFPGLVVEGTLDDCVDRGRFALQIRAWSENGPALFIDNGRQRPGYEELACCFDSCAADIFITKTISPHFVLKNPEQPRTQLSTFCLGTFGATKEHVLQAGEPIYFDFVLGSAMRLQERKKPRNAKNKVRHDAH